MEYDKKNSYHIPVLYREVIEGLNLRSNSLIVDGTLGGGGHTGMMLEKNKKLKILATDRDLEAIEYTTKRLEKYKNRLEIVHANFKEITEILKEKNIKADGVLLDLGVSSHQIDDAERGFSFRFDAKLDMRMDKSQELTAYDVINEYSEERLVEIFSSFGEEKFSKRIAKHIILNRPIETTGKLKETIESVVNKINRKETQNSVQRVFQAVRIEVNAELTKLYDFIVSLPEVLNSGARIAIISFHSLEDRIVKTAFQELCTNCICPPKLPICVCNHKAKAKHITRKPITAKQDELKENSRSSCAKLRIIEIL